MKRLLVFVFLLASVAGCLRQPEETRKAPAGETVAATVLGRPITVDELDPAPKALARMRKELDAEESRKLLARHRRDALKRVILEALLMRYANENGIRAEDVEIEAFVARFQKSRARRSRELEEDRADLREELRSPGLSQGEKQRLYAKLKTVENILDGNLKKERYDREHGTELRKMEEDTARKVITSWKVNNSLFRRFGGRVIFQQAGPEPIDAYREFLREQEGKGSFQILDKGFKGPFWEYFTNDDMHSFYPEETGVEIMSAPWWLSEN